MLIKTLAVGPLQGNCFIIADEETREAMVIDPGDEPDRILDAVNGDGLKVKYIVCTHGHFDHIGVVGDIKKATGAAVVLHQQETDLYNAAQEWAHSWGFEMDPLPAPDVTVDEGDIITIGKHSFKVLHCPGHSPGGISLYGGDVLITGDTLFAGSVGRTDFPGGDLLKLKGSFRRLLALPEETRVLPGHGPATTVGKEAEENMFADEFLR